MAKALLESSGGVGKSSVKLDKPKKLSKIGEWRRANPCANGANGVILDMRAVLR